MGELGINLRLARARVRGELTYRAAFASFTIAQLLITSLDCVAILALFGRIDDLGGWTRGQVLFVYASAVLAFGLADMTAGSVEYASPRIIDGSFDSLLIRPLHVLPHLLADQFALRRIGRVAQAGIVMAATVASGSVSIAGAGRVVLAVLAILGGAVTFSAIFVITNTLCFFVPAASETANAFTYGGVTMAQYPTHIFSARVRNAAMWIIPAGLVIYAPAIHVLRAPNPLGLPEWLQWATPLAGAPLWLVAAHVWRSGLRHYESTGS